MSGKWTIERAVNERPPLLHPMAGCDPATLKKHLAANSDFDDRSRRQRMMSKLLVGIRYPFALAEKIRWERKIEHYELPKDPVFIIGHWRSGTTHLHNLMSRDPQFAWIDFGQTATPHGLLSPMRHVARAIIRKALPESRGMDRVELSVDSPQEEEMALGSLNPLSYYNVYYFPRDMRRHFDRSVLFENVSPEELNDFKKAYLTLVRKLTVAGNGNGLLLKNPPSTARIKLLKELFPGAKFVYIGRNPYEVFVSMLNHYPRVLSAFAWQRFDDVDLEEMVFYKYPKLLKAYLEQRSEIQEGDLVETSYEAVTANPLAELKRIYRALELEGEDRALPSIKEHILSKSGYRRNVHEIQPGQVERIGREWDFAFEEWGYDKKLPECLRIAEDK